MMLTLSLFHVCYIRKNWLFFFQERAPLTLLHSRKLKNGFHSRQKKSCKSRIYFYLLSCVLFSLIGTLYITFNSKIVHTRFSHKAQYDIVFLPVLKIFIFPKRVHIYVYFVCTVNATLS